MKKTYLLITCLLALLSALGCTSKKEQLTASTLTIAIEPGALPAVAPGNPLQLSTICKSANSDNVDISPVWSVENNLGTFNPASGKSTVFTAANTNGTGKIYASFADIRSEGVTVTVGSGGGGGGSGTPSSAVLFADAGMSTDLAPVSGSSDMLYFFDDIALSAHESGTAWRIAVQNELSGCPVDTQKSMKVTYTDAAGGWGGFFLQFNTNMNMSSYTKLTFYAKAEGGDEVCKIKIKDSLGASGEVTKTFTTNWQKFEVPLSGFSTVDKSKILQPFILAFENILLSGNATVYIDYIKYE